MIQPRDYEGSSTILSPNCCSSGNIHALFKKNHWRNVMRILIVEDDKATADGLLRWLRISGYAVDHSITGDIALRAAAEEHYDRIMLDIGLPDIDGFDVLRSLRKLEQDGGIMILTASDSEADRVRGLDLGADDYVVKPFSLPELEARVRALIRRTQAVRTPLLDFGKLSVNLTARRVTIGSSEIELTPREWGILEYLMRRAGQVVSKDQMLQAVCSWDDDLTYNVIEVYVSRLRAKLQAAAVRIRTVRGFGYIFEDLDLLDGGTQGNAGGEQSSTH